MMKKQVVINRLCAAPIKTVVSNVVTVLPSVGGCNSVGDDDVSWGKTLVKHACC